MQTMKTLNNKVVGAVIRGGIAVIPTDTIYGIVGSALFSKTVEKIYWLRKRNREKPMIILIGDIGQLSFFGIKLNSEIKRKLKQFWPGKVSVVFPCRFKKFFYLHRGKNTLAFRLPQSRLLRSFLLKTGPLVAPSANIEGMKPAETVKEAKEYFGSEVGFYVDQGKRTGEASSIISLSAGRINILRKGAGIKNIV
jgi:L-threonylcarbamoyladenylate synthase